MRNDAGHRSGRNYLLKDGVTGDFIRYFEEHFLVSQREEGKDATLLVVLSAYRHREHYATMRTEWSHSKAWCTVLQGDMRALLADDVETIRLRPNAKSLIRYHSNELE